MDPTACFQNWLDLKSALDDPRNEDRDEINDTASNLLDWLQQGGFQPDQWADPKHGNDLRREFCGWCEEQWSVAKDE